MTAESSHTNELLRRSAGGDEEALQELFSQHREQLKRMVRLRLDRRLHGRLDESDVLQESLLEAARKLPAYLDEPTLPFFLWLRDLTGRKLAEAHRRHLGTAKRNADNEVSLQRGPLPEASTVSLAAMLLGKLTAPADAAMKAELRLKVQEALNQLDPVDREVLALRHFEQLSTSETAQVLGLSRSGAGSRYLQAIKRLRRVLAGTPGLDLREWGHQ